MKDKNNIKQKGFSCLMPEEDKDALDNLVAASGMKQKSFLIRLIRYAKRNASTVLPELLNS
jgi:hypothetical protein